MNGRRFAKCDFRLDQAERTPEGYLQGLVPVTQCGVFSYRNVADDGSWDGTWRQELRHPEDVHEKASLDSLRMCPVQDEHVAMVDSSNVDQLKVGHLGELYEVGPLPQGVVKIPIRIDSPRGLAVVAKGKKQLSMGYDLELEEAPAGSMYLGKPYTHRQRKIRYNHIAITDLARLGPEMRLDSADAVEGDSESSHLQKEPLMLTKKVNIDSVEYEAPAQVVVAYDKMAARVDASEEEKKAAEKALEDEKKENKKGMDALQAKCDSALADAKTAQDALAKLEKEIPARAALIAKDAADLMSVASAVMAAPEAAKLKGMDSAKIKVAIIKAKYPEANLDGKSDTYIDGRFDSIREAVKITGTEANAQNRLDASQFNDDAASLPVVNLDSKREAMIKRNGAAYQNPTGVAVK